ncbi:MAG: exodeoxyribonuclease V subunit alpha [Betaproteobacteria bacterium]|nr:exodeoxyribonuclease V subunit alpha [Betaproteobacteria bacterium]
MTDAKGGMAGVAGAAGTEGSDGSDRSDKPDGILRPVDKALVRFFSDRLPGLSSPVLLAVGLASYQLGRGHVCLDLAHVLEDPAEALGLTEPAADTADTPVSEEAREIRMSLAGLCLANWVQSLSEVTGLVSPGESALGNTCPLVIAGHRLYLRCYWHYERLVESAIRYRLTTSTANSSPNDAAAADSWPLFVSVLSALFPSTELSVGSGPPKDSRFTDGQAEVGQPKDSQTKGGQPTDGQTARRQPIDWQKIACAVAARSSFAVITGGPGTGKTTTVVRLLALLQTMAFAKPAAQPLRIAVAAPTGKAAARLRAALVTARQLLPKFMQNDDVLMRSIPTEVTTLHRLLGARTDSRRFQHDARQPLPIDLLIIDEASMIDLEMTAAVVVALPEAARLVLLGDKDQLSSVEAGGVLSQLCARAESGDYWADTAQWVLEATGVQIPAASIRAEGRDLDQQVVMLRGSRRFDPSGGIGRIASAVHAGHSEALSQALHAEDDAVRLHTLTGPLPAALNRVFSLCLNRSSGRRGAPAFGHGLDGFLQLLHRLRPAAGATAEAYSQWAEKVLLARHCFQVLCAIRAGPLGIDQVNLVIESLLAREGLLVPQGLWYEGRPVLVTRNDYSLGLMNGDMGVTFSLPIGHPVNASRTEALRVAFLTDDAPGGVRWVLPSRLTSAQTVFALTVHKSQGSEFDECLMVLPDSRQRGLTRELLYTGITRARQRIGIAAQGGIDEVLQTAMARVTRRAGGLFT